MSDLASAPSGGVQRRGGSSDLKSFLNSPAVLAKLREVCGAAMKPEDLVRLTLIAASRSPDLLKCSQESVIRSLMDAAALRIRPGGLMGRGYLVSRRNNKNNTTECCFDPGWRGLIDIARRSGQIKRIEAHVVYADDVFEVVRTPLTNIRHVPSEKANPGEVRAAYAVAEFTGGEVQIEIMYRRDLDRVRKLGAGGGPWATWFDEMARKSAVRRLCKYLPYDPQLDEAVRVMDKADGGADDEPAFVSLDDPPLEKQTAAKQLASKIKQSRREEPPPASAPEEPEQPVVDYDPETGELVPPEREPGED